MHATSLVLTTSCRTSKDVCTLSFASRTTPSARDPCSPPSFPLKRPLKSERGGSIPFHCEYSYHRGIPSPEFGVRSSRAFHLPCLLGSGNTPPAFAGEPRSPSLANIRNLRPTSLPNCGLFRPGHVAPPVFRCLSAPLPALVGGSRSPWPPSWGRGRARRWRHFAIASSRRWRLRARLLGRRCVCVAFRSRYVVLARHGRDEDDEGGRKERRDRRGPAGGAGRGGRTDLLDVLCCVRGDGVGRTWSRTVFGDGKGDRTRRKTIPKPRKTVGPTRAEGDETTATTTCVEKHAS